MNIENIRVGTVVTGPLWPEPLEVLATVELGASVEPARDSAPSLAI